jgi:Tfp pilus assembly protein PilE
MRSLATIVGLVLALGGSYFVYQTYITRSNLTQAPPQQQIDVIGIRSDLLAIGQAERQYLIAQGTYGTLEELLQAGLSTVGTERRGYIFSAVVDGSRAFTITATPSDANKVGWPTLAINETMQITER